MSAIRNVFDVLATKAEEAIPILDCDYTDEATAKIAYEIALNPELKALFDVQHDMDPEDMRALRSMALALKRKAERLDNDDPA